MSTFDARSAGTGEPAWSTCRWLRDATRVELTDHERVVVLAAHADDETLGAGGLIGHAAELGLGVHVVIATDGAASHPGSPTHTAQMLATRRRAEAVEAVRTLNTWATIDFLDLPDGELARHAGELDHALGWVGDAAVLLMAPWLHDRHPDHAACARAARRIMTLRPEMQLLEFPIWMWHWADPADPGDEPLALDPAIGDVRRLELDGPLHARKQRAIDCYPSQTRPLSEMAGDEAVLNPTALDHFTRHDEYYFRIEATR